MIRLQNIYKSYNKGKENEVKVLHGVNLEFPSTGLVFIVGKSGSGKSTLLNILGLLDKFDEGEYFLDDKSIKTFSETQEDAFRALNVGFVFQEFNIIEKYSIGENITLPVDIAQMDLTREHAEALLTKVGLEGYYDRFAGDISGGQKQRVALARALIKDPKIILADEPTGALDSKTSGEIFDLLSELSKEKLIIVVSHDLDSAYRFGDKVVEIRDGQIGAITDGDAEVRVTRIVTEDTKLTPEQIQQVERAIKKGEKVLISPSKKSVVSKSKAKKPLEVPDNASRQIKQKPKLSFKATAKIAVLSMKSKRFRLAFTIIFCSIVIAVLGFTTILTSFDKNRIIMSEWQKANVNFAVLKAATMNKDENEMLSTWSERDINFDLYQEIDKLNIPYARSIPNAFRVGENHLEFVIRNGRYQTSGYYDYRSMGLYEIPNFEQFAPVYHGEIPSNEPTIVSHDYGVFEIYEVAISNSTFNSLVKMKFDSWISTEDVKKDEILTYEDLFTADLLLQYGRDSEFIGLPNSENDAFLTKRICFKVVGVCEFDISAYDHFRDRYETNKHLNDLTQEERREFYYFIAQKMAYLNWFYLAEGAYFDTPLRDAYEPTALTSSGNFSFDWFDIYGEDDITTVDIDEREKTIRAAAAPNTLLINDVFDVHGLPISQNIILKDGLTKEGFEEYKTGDKVGVIISSYYLYDYILPRAMVFADNSRDYRFNISSLSGVHDYLNYARGRGLDILNSTMTFRYTHDGMSKEIEVEILGVWFTQGDYMSPPQTDIWSQMYLSPTFFREYNVERVENALIFFENAREFRAFLNTIENYTFTVDGDDDNLYRFQINMGNSRFAYQIENMFALFDSIFVWLFWLLALIAFLLSYSLINSSIQARQKEIGILRSLGATKWDTAKIFVFEGSIIALFQAAIGSLFCYLGYVAMNQFVFVENFGALAKDMMILDFVWYASPIVAGLAIVSVGLGVMFPLFKFFKKQPVDVIRAGKKE